MFGLNKQQNSHIISVLRNYFADRKSGQTDKIRAGASIIHALLAGHDISQAMREAAKAFPMPDNGETMSSILSWDFLTAEMDAVNRKKAPKGFDYTILLLGFIHYHVPSFSMIYKREVLKEEATLKSLQLFSIAFKMIKQHRCCLLSFADKSLSTSQLGRFSQVSSGGAEVVTLYDHKALVHALAPLFKKHGIDISYDPEDDRSLVRSIVFQVPVNFVEKDFLALLADLTAHGIVISALPSTHSLYSLYQTLILEKLAEKYIGDKDGALCLHVIKEAKLPACDDLTELVSAIVNSAIEKGQATILRKAYKMLPQSNKSEMAKHVAQECLDAKVPSLRREAAYFLSECGLSPYRYQRLRVSAPDHETQYPKRAGFWCNDTVKAITQDDQLNKYSQYVVDYYDNHSKHTMV